MNNLGMTPDEFIEECADDQNQKDFFNSLTEENKDNVRTFMLAYRGYGTYLMLESLRAAMSKREGSLDDEIDKLMKNN
jgi:hypothetical protein